MTGEHRTYGQRRPKCDGRSRRGCAQAVLGGALFAALLLVGCEGASGPSIERLEPASARHGETVTVRGAGFCGPERAAATGECAALPAGAVALGLSPPMTRAEILAWSDAAITVQVPGAAPLGPTALIVTVDGRSSNAATLEIKP